MRCGGVLARSRAGQTRVIQNPAAERPSTEICNNEDDDCDEGTHLVGVNINGPDPRRAFAGLVAFARGRRLSLFDSQADGLVDLDAPGELPRLFAGEAEGVTPARLMWASELEPRLRGESEVPSGGGSD